LDTDSASAGWDEVDRYFVEKLVGQDDALDAALAASDEAGLPQISVAPNQGKLLFVLATSIGARRVLEIGTLGGYSTIWLARALPEDGLIISLELSGHHAATARSNIERAGFGDQVDVRVGPALPSLDALVAGDEPPFDLVFIDADQANNAVYLDRAMHLVRRGSLIVVDNVVRHGRIIDPSSGDADVDGSRAVIEALGAHPRLSATALQTVGSKGYDGFPLAVVTSDE